jgi:hypothetical protein
MKRSYSYIFWDTVLYSPFKVNGRFKEKCLFYLQGLMNKTRKKPDASVITTYFMLVSCLDYSSTLKMEAKFSSEMSVNF